MSLVADALNKTPALADREIVLVNPMIRPVNIRRSPWKTLFFILLVMAITTECVVLLFHRFAPVAVEQNSIAVADTKVIQSEWINEAALTPDMDGQQWLDIPEHDIAPVDDAKSFPVPGLSISIRYSTEKSIPPSIPDNIEHDNRAPVVDDTPQAVEPTVQLSDQTDAINRLQQQVSDLLTMNRPLQAFQLLQQNEALVRADLQLMQSTAKLAIRNGHPDMAVALIDASQPPEMQMLKALAFEKMDNMASARSIYAAMLEQGVLPGNGLIKLAVIMEQQQELNSALALYRRYMTVPDRRDDLLYFARQRLQILESRKP